MRIAILTDSSSGLQNQSFDNLFVIALPIIFPNLEIVDDDIADETKQLQILTSIDNSTLKTSCLNPALLEKKIMTILQKFDYVYYLPIAYNLSSQYENSLLLLTNEFLRDKITIVKHYFTGIQLGNFILMLLQLFGTTNDSTSINIETLVNDWETKTLLSVLPGDIKILARGGRVNKLIVKIIDRVNLKVAILWGKKAKKIIGKNYHTLIKKYLDYMQEYLKINGNDYEVYLAHTRICDSQLLELIQKEFRFHNIKVKTSNLPTIFAVHGGKNTLGIVTCKL